MPTIHSNPEILEKFKVKLTPLHEETLEKAHELQAEADVTIDKDDPHVYYVKARPNLSTAIVDLEDHPHYTFCSCKNEHLSSIARDFVCVHAMLAMLHQEHIDDYHAWSKAQDREIDQLAKQDYRELPSVQPTTWIREELRDSETPGLYNYEIVEVNPTPELTGETEKHGFKIGDLVQYTHPEAPRRTPDLICPYVVKGFTKHDIVIHVPHLDCSDLHAQPSHVQFRDVPPLYNELEEGKLYYVLVRNGKTWKQWKKAKFIRREQQDHPRGPLYHFLIVGDTNRRQYWTDQLSLNVRPIH